MLDRAGAERGSVYQWVERFFGDSPGLVVPYLSLVFEIQVTDSVLAMLLALPYGALADRIGRKPVLLLAVIGCFANDVWTRVVCK